MRGSGDGDKAALNIRDAAAAAPPSSFDCVRLASIFKGSEADFKARRPHAGRKLNPAVIGDIMEPLNGGGGALQQGGIIQRDHREGRCSTRVGGYCIPTRPRHRGRLRRPAFRGE